MYQSVLAFGRRAGRTAPTNTSDLNGSCCWAGFIHTTKRALAPQNLDPMAERVPYSRKIGKRNRLGACERQVFAPLSSFSLETLSRGHQSTGSLKPNSQNESRVGELKTNARDTATRVAPRSRSHLFVLERHNLRANYSLQAFHRRHSRRRS